MLPQEFSSFLRLLRYKLNLHYTQAPRCASLTCYPGHTRHPHLQLKITTLRKWSCEYTVWFPPFQLISNDKMNFLKKATAVDDALQMVKTLIIKGWPAYKRDTPTCTRPYWPLCDELHIIEGLVFRGESLVIPPSVRHEMLTNLHESHLGIEKCKARERSSCTSLEWGETSRKQNQGAPYVPNTSLPIPASHLSRISS